LADQEDKEKNLEVAYEDSSTQESEFVDATEIQQVDDNGV
jgi:hypothetical protein